MADQQIRPYEWYVIFAENVRPPPWWQKPFLLFHPRQFGHVCLYKPVTEHHAFLIDPTHTYLKTELYELDITVHQTMLNISKDATVLHITMEPDDKVNATFLQPTCVSVVKYNMGFNSKATRPYSLYKDLLKRGASQL